MRKRGLSLASAERRRRGGMATLEFAGIGLIVIFTLIGLLEAVWQITVSAALEGATQRASRFGVTGQQTRSGAPTSITCRSDTIRWIVTSAGGGILKQERLTINMAAYASASSMTGASTPGAGGGGQVVSYALEYREPFLTGLWLDMIGGQSSMTHRASVVVKNEMFSNATC